MRENDNDGFDKCRLFSMPDCSGRTTRSLYVLFMDDSFIIYNYLKDLYTIFIASILLSI